jgi:2-polyprenyl-6-hydroxyphenyl methylase/3-demethylubiquinone-9 3-methyltransferase
VSDAATEIADGRRFAFGRNWRRFLARLGEEDISAAQHSLQMMLDVQSLEGLRLLDVGCGSGLFSLAAIRLGAARVHSLDYDPESVACARELRRLFAIDAGRWSIEGGSALDRGYLSSLGQWDVVYSWGVLHHTGKMWEAMGNVSALVAPGGTLFIAIYNDQGWQSAAWRAIKRFYNLGIVGRTVTLALFFPLLGFSLGLGDALRLRNPFARYLNYGRHRGMSLTRDWVDWLGGYPFEVARPPQVVDFFTTAGFTIQRLVTCGRKPGCNEFVLRRT